MSDTLIDWTMRALAEQHGLTRDEIRECFEAIEDAGDFETSANLIEFLDVFIAEGILPERDAA